MTLELTFTEITLAHTGALFLLKSGTLTGPQQKKIRSILKKLTAEHDRLRCKWCSEREASRPDHLCHRCHRYREVNGILPPEYVLIASGVKKTRKASNP